jgi:hypothetical protein
MRRRGKAFLIDANVLLRFLLGDDPAQSPRAHGLMRRLEEGQTVAKLKEIAWRRPSGSSKSMPRCLGPRSPERCRRSLRFKVFTIEGNA